MNTVARFIARQIWWCMLWMVRRPWRRRFWMNSTGLFPASARAQIRKRMLAQNRMARRYALPLLTFALNMLLASIIITSSYFALVNFAEHGGLTRPKRLDSLAPQEGS